MRKWLKPLIGIPLLILLIILSRLFELDQRLIMMQDWVAGHGIIGPLVFIGIYITAVVLLIPGSILTITAGALFGSLVGVLVVIIGATIGAALSFLVSRYLARDLVQSILSKNEKFIKLDSLVEKNGAIIVAITRLVPLFPFNLLNFGFGLTKVHFWVYVMWSAICMLPGTILYVVGADAITTGINEGRVPWLLVGIILFIAAALTMIVRRARGKLSEGNDE